MVSFKAVAIGALIDIVGSLSIGIVIAIFLVVSLVSSGVSENELEQLAKARAMEPPWNIMGYVLGLLMSVLAGFVTAKLAKRQVYYSAGIVGAISSIFCFYLSHEIFSLAFNTFLSLLTIASVLAGSFLWVKKNAPER